MFNLEFSYDTNPTVVIEVPYVHKVLFLFTNVNKLRN